MKTSSAVAVQSGSLPNLLQNSVESSSLTVLDGRCSEKDMKKEIE